MSAQLAERVQTDGIDTGAADQRADLETPVTMVVPFTEQTMMAVALRLHDGKCHQQRKGGCTLRRVHAHSSFLDDARRHLIALNEAFAAGELS